MQLASALAAALSASLRWLAPRACAACDGPLGPARVFCAACDTGQRPFAGRVAELPVCAAGAYAPPLVQAIQRFKYGARGDLAAQLAELLLAAVRAHGIDQRPAPLVVPVPLHPLKLAARGYNQSALVGRIVARRLGLPWGPLALARVRHTAAQATQSRSERLQQLEGAFVVRRPQAVAGRPILLIDDVVTTGATSRACAQALQAAGASLALIAALARTE